LERLIYPTAKSPNPQQATIQEDRQESLVKERLQPCYRTPEYGSWRFSAPQQYGLSFSYTKNRTTNNSAAQHSIQIISELEVAPEQYASFRFLQFASEKNCVFTKPIKKLAVSLTRTADC
jgi:hypothetical protein